MCFMGMPAGLKAIDLMIDFPSDDAKKRYDFLRPLLLDKESREQFDKFGETLVPIMALKRVQQFGHSAVALIGGCGPACSGDGRRGGRWTGSLHDDCRRGER